MKKVMTPAEKAQYFALYWGQEVVTNSLWEKGYKRVLNPHLECISSFFGLNDGFFLLLRSIEQLTDDELKDISERLGFINTLSITERHMIESRMVSDTLRDMGIATPWKHYSIQDLIDNGVLKFES